jgi:hypothetical protein
MPAFTAQAHSHEAVRCVRKGLAAQPLAARQAASRTLMA